MRVVIQAIHYENGTKFEWLLPDDLFESFNRLYKKAKYHNVNIDLLALVQTYIGVSVVKVVGFYFIKDKKLIKKNHPFEKVIYLWQGFAKDSIANFKRQRYIGDYEQMRLDILDRIECYFFDSSNVMGKSDFETIKQKVKEQE